MGLRASRCQLERTRCEECRLDAAVEALTGGQDLEGDVKNSQALLNHKLLTAARDGKLEVIQAALARGAFIETRRPFVMTLEYVEHLETASDFRGVGLTPLMVAAEEGHEAAVRLLLQAGACANMEDEDGMRPLHLAAFAGCPEACMALLAGGADPEAQDDEGRAAMDHVPRQCLASAADRKLWRSILERQPAKPAEKLQEEQIGI